MEEKIIAIYAIKDNREDKVIYVGLTTDYVHRKRCHFNQKKTPIDNYMFDECRVNFDMYILEKIDEDYDLNELRDKEQFYIDKFNTNETGFNIRRSGNISKDINKYNREYNKTEKRKEYNREFSRKRYKSEKFKEYQKEYNKEYHKEYQKSEKFKEYQRQYRLKKKQENQNRDGQ